MGSSRIGRFHLQVSFSGHTGKSDKMEAVWQQLAGGQEWLPALLRPLGSSCTQSLAVLAVLHLADFTPSIPGLATVDVWVCDH